MVKELKFIVMHFNYFQINIFFLFSNVHTITLRLMPDMEKTAQCFFSRYNYKLHESHNYILNSK